MSTSTFRRDSLLLCVYGACLWFLFSPGLLHSHIPAFRDGYHFYYPQAVWLDQRASAGDYFPLWNANEGLGSSVPGQASSALFYPLRVVWFLPGLSVAQRYSLFVVVHLGLAAAGMAYAARRLSVSKNGSLLAAVSYSLSAPVFFQHTNLIYLSSAAWIGFALGALAAWGRRSDSSSWWQGLAMFSVATSLMVLGGDLHTAVNAYLLAGAFHCLHWIWAWRRARRASQANFRPATAALGGLAWLGTAALGIALLSAIQWIPTLRWAEHSGRVASSTPLPETTLLAPPHAAIADRLESVDDPPHRIYDFSLSPWHVPTMIWPTLGGHYLPANSRWFAALPAEGRMWIPSLYLGFLPCLFLVSAFHRSVDVTVRWLLGLAAFSLLASLGNYSLLWLTEQLLSPLGMSAWFASSPPASMGSVYGCLAAWIPGYEAFRYPAKWTVWFVAACSLLAASRADAYFSNPYPEHPVAPGLITRPLKALILGASSLLAIGAVSLWIWESLHAGPANEASGIAGWLSHRAADRWLGSPDVFASMCTVLIAASVPLLLWPGVHYCRHLGLRGLTYLTLIEMTLVASCWTTFVGASQGDSVPTPPESGHRPLVWVDISEVEFPARPGEVSLAVWQTQLQDAFLLGKLAALADVRNLAASQSIEPRQWTRLRHWLAHHDRFSPDQPELDRVLRQLGVSHRLMRQPDSKDLAWKLVDNPRPLCELLPDSVTDVRWEWPHSGELLIQVHTSQPGVLLIRQWHDGGWSATLHRSAHRAEPWPLSAPGTPFIETRLPSGDSTLTLRRKWFW